MEGEFFIYGHTIRKYTPFLYKKGVAEKENSQENNDLTIYVLVVFILSCGIDENATNLEVYLSLFFNSKDYLTSARLIAHQYENVGLRSFHHRNLINS